MTAEIFEEGFGVGADFFVVGEGADEAVAAVDGVEGLACFGEGFFGFADCSFGFVGSSA